MKKLLCVLAVLCLSAAPAFADTIVSVGTYTWDVGQTNTIMITVSISGGALIDNATVAFSVGDGGSDLGGTEAIKIASIGYGTGTIWAGHTAGPSVWFPLPSGAANIQSMPLSTVGDTVTGSGVLMTFTLQAPTGGLAAEVGQTLTLDPNADSYSVLGKLGVDTPNQTWLTGQLHLVQTPEPSTGVMLLVVGGMWLGWRRFRKS